MLTVYRLEHKDSLLGPFEHAGQIPEVINKGVYATNPPLTDIDKLPEVQRLLRLHKKAKFGYLYKEMALQLIRDALVLAYHGFVVRELEVEPIYISDDGQVLFNDQRIPINYEITID